MKPNWAPKCPPNETNKVAPKFQMMYRLQLGPGTKSGEDRDRDPMKQLGAVEWGAALLAPVAPMSLRPPVGRSAGIGAPILRSLHFTGVSAGQPP